MSIVVSSLGYHIQLNVKSDLFGVNKITTVLHHSGAKRHKHLFLPLNTK